MQRDQNAKATDGARHPGVYLLLIRLRRKTQWDGASGGGSLPAGWYAYTGSAMGGFEAP